MKRFLPSLCLCLVCACGSSIDEGTGGVGSTTGGTGSSTTGGTGSSTTGTTTGGGTSTGGSSPSSIGPTPAVMDSGTYSVSVVLDMSSVYTTCAQSTCDSMQSSPATYYWTVTDNSNGGASYSIGGSAYVDVTSGNQWNAASGPFYGTSTAGCADSETGGYSYSLSTTSFYGAVSLGFQAAACNGYQSVNCTCMYNVSASETSSSDSGRRLTAGPNNALSKLLESAVPKANP